MQLGKTLRTHGPTIAFVLAVALASLFGGSSRYDNWQLIALQPLGWLIAGYFVLILPRDAYREQPAIAALLGGWFVFLVLQLIPLPQIIWTNLPGRELVAELDRLLGFDQWRPMSLVPTRTLNALTNLGVPLATLLGYLALRGRASKIATYAILSVAALNAAVGLLQVLGPSNFLYFYHGNNNQTAVGLFANPNHAGVFGAAIMVFIAAVAIELRPQTGARKSSNGSALPLLLYGLYGFVFVIAIMSASRAALITSVLALAATSAMLAIGPVKRWRANRERGKGRALGQLPLAALSTAVIGVAIAVLFALQGRLPAFDQFVAEDQLGDFRFLVLPVLIDMSWIYFPVGSGVGTFENVYYIHEPDELLQPSYVNMAHNDWLQLVIEGGAVAVAFLLALFGWMALLLRRLIQGAKPELAIALASGVALVALAAWFDYALRTALMQSVVILALLAVNDRSNPQNRPGA